MSGTIIDVTGTINDSHTRTAPISYRYCFVCILLLILRCANNASHLASAPKSDTINGGDHRHLARLDGLHNKQEVRSFASRATGCHLLDVCPSTEGSLLGPRDNDHRYRVVALHLSQGVEYGHTHVVAERVERRVA